MLDDNQTLPEYIKSLSKEDRELLCDLPLNDIDAVTDMDSGDLEKIKNKSDPNLTKGQKYRRFEIIQRISDLRPFALAERDCKNNPWNHHMTELNPHKKNDRTLREFTTYKYSQIGHSELYEAIIIDNSPRFIMYNLEIGRVKIFNNIKQETRILVPPAYEEYPYTPYEFKDKQQLYEYIKRAKAETIESLYRQALSIVKQYNSQDEYKQVLIATDIVWSYFQDKFGTTHYVGIVGDNGSGKSSAGNTFEALAYRCVNATNPSPANIFRILGVVEPGQCTLVLDESRSIDDSPDMISILNTGYDYQKKVAKINTNTIKQEFFFTFCLKVIIGETSVSQYKAKGVMDRTLQFTTYPAEPKYDIKEVTSPQGNPDRIRELDRLMDFRKLMLVYRLIHFRDPIADIDIGIKGRNKELCKPYIQLFYGTCVQHDIEKTLQKFIDIKNEKKSVSLEYALVPLLQELIQKEGSNSIVVSKVWQEIITKFGFKPYIYTNSYTCTNYDEAVTYPDEYNSSEYGMLYKKTVVKIIYDKFAEPIRIGHERTRVMLFDIEKLKKLENSYNFEIKIKTKLKKNAGHSQGEDDVDNADNADNDSEGVVHNLEGNNENEDVADTLVDTNNIGIIKYVSSNNDNSYKNYNSPSTVGSVSEDNTTRSVVRNVRTVRSVDQPRNAGKIHRIGHTDKWECEECSIRDDIHFMKDHACSGFKPINQSPTTKQVMNDHMKSRS